MSPQRTSQQPADTGWDLSHPPSAAPRVRRHPARRALSSTVAAMLALFLLAVGASAYYAFTMSEQYTGRSLVQFRPRTTTNGGVVSNETAASSAAGYAAYLGVPSTLRSVSTQIAVPLQELRDNMGVQLIPATTSLSITFEDTDPVVAARAASALAQVAAERATDDPLVSATVLAPASVPDLPSSPSKKVVLGAGAVLGLLLAVVAYVISAGRRRARPAAAEAAPTPSAGSAQPADQPATTSATPRWAATTTAGRAEEREAAGPEVPPSADGDAEVPAAGTPDRADAPTRPVLTGR